MKEVFKHKTGVDVIFVHPRKLAFFSGVIIARIDSNANHRDTPKGISYMVELRNKTEIHYIEERFVFTDLEDSKANIFKALQGVG